METAGIIGVNFLRDLQERKFSGLFGDHSMGHRLNSLI